MKQLVATVQLAPAEIQEVNIPAINAAWEALWVGPGQVEVVEPRKKPRRRWVGTWWKPWTWLQRCWVVEYRFTYSPGGHENDS